MCFLIFKAGNSETRKGRAGLLETLWERSEPGQGYCQLTVKSEKRKPWRVLSLPAAPLVTSLVGPLELKRKKIHWKRRFEWACHKEGIPLYVS